MLALLIEKHFFFIYGWYNQHEMSDSSFTFGAIFYSTKTRSKFPTFMLALLFQI